MAGAAGHHDQDVLRFLDDAQRALAVHLVDTVAPPHAEHLGVALADLGERDAGVLEERPARALLVEALAGGDGGVLGAEDEEGFLARRSCSSR